MSKLDFGRAVKQEEEYLRRLYPTPDDIPGCMSLFDTFLSCNVIRSQVKSLYRHGERPECSQKLEDFKFCLTLKSLHPEERRDVWIRRRAEWWAKRRLNRSSEDVWDIREYGNPSSRSQSPSRGKKWSKLARLTEDFTPLPGLW